MPKGPETVQASTHEEEIKEARLQLHYELFEQHRSLDTVNFAEKTKDLESALYASSVNNSDRNIWLPEIHPHHPTVTRFTRLWHAGARTEVTIGHNENLGNPEADCAIYVEGEEVVGSVQVEWAVHHVETYLGFPSVRPDPKFSDDNGRLFQPWHSKANKIDRKWHVLKHGKKAMNPSHFND